MALSLGEMAGISGVGSMGMRLLCDSIEACLLTATSPSSPKDSKKSPELFLLVGSQLPSLLPPGLADSEGHGNASVCLVETGTHLQEK